MDGTAQRCLLGQPGCGGETAAKRCQHQHGQQGTAAVPSGANGPHCLGAFGFGEGWSQGIPQKTDHVLDC